jgi:hypothetical protein
MPAATRRKADTGKAFLAAARHFELLAKLCASPKASHTPRLTARQMAASMKRFKKAPQSDLDEVRAFLNMIVAEIDKIEPKVESDEGAKS